MKSETVYRQPANATSLLSLARRPGVLKSIRTGLFLVCAFVLMCCGDNKQSKAWTGPVRIAVVIPDAGPLKEEGRMLELGALMAMDETGGRVADLSVEMVAYDSPCDPEGAIATARQLAADPSVNAVVGHLCAEEVAAALPIYQQSHLALINPTVSAEYIRQDERRHLFPLLYGDGEQAAFIAAYIKRGLDLTRVAVISDESTYGNILRASFLAEAERLGLELVAKLAIRSNQAEAARAVELLKDARPEAIFLATYPNAARRFLLERHQQHLAGEVLGPDQLGDLDLYEMAGEAAEGLLVCQPILLDRDNGEEDGFVRRFELLHKRQPDWIAAGGYDAMRLALEVLSLSGPGRKAFLEAMREISGQNVAFGGLSGPVFFRDNGRNQRPLYVGIIRQGKVRAAKPPTVEFPFLPTKQ